MAVETNVNTSMPDEHPSKCPKLQFEQIDRDPASRKQICEFPIDKQDEIRQAYIEKGPYQPKNINYPYNDNTHRRRFQPSWFFFWRFLFSIFLFLTSLEFRLNFQHVQVYDDI